MIRARLSDGRFLFGVDAENVRRLKAGQPLVIDLTMMGGKDQLVIVYGDTLQDIVRELEAAHDGPLPPAQPWPNETKEQ